MRTPWTHFGELSNVEMAVWILVMMIVGSLTIILLGRIGEKIGDRLRMLFGDYREEPPRYWRDLSTDDTKH